MSEVASTTTTAVGYYEGVLDVYVALITTPGNATTKPVYGTPEVMGHSMEVKVTPRYREGKVFASNMTQRYRKEIDGYDVSVKVDQLMAGVRNKLIGVTTDTHGVGGSTGADRAPECAIGFALPMDNGEQELWWLVRGKFSDFGVDTKTEEEGIEYQHPTMEGRFDRRLPDDRVSYVLNTADLPEADAALAEKWFTKVYDGTIPS